MKEKKKLRIDLFREEKKWNFKDHESIKTNNKF